MEVVPDSTLEVLQRVTLSEDQAEAIFEQGRDAVVFALLELSKQLAEARGPQATPSTPSGMIPVYEKPTTKSRKKRPGAKTGHPSSRRPVPDRIDRRETHKSPCCPDCGGRWKRTGDTRTRSIEDIPQVEPEVTEHTIDRSRGSPALLKFFTAEFSGTLVSDFWGADNVVACAQRQMCLLHLLRDLAHVDQDKRNGPAKIGPLLPRSSGGWWPTRFVCGTDNTS